MFQFYTPENIIFLMLSGDINGNMREKMDETHSISLGLNIVNEETKELLSKII